MNKYKKISELTSINWENLSKSEDVIPVVDISESLTKKITVSQLVGVASAQVYVIDVDTECEVKNGIYYFRIPKKLNERKLVDIAGCCIEPGTGGTMQIQIYNINLNCNLLLTPLTIDSNVIDSKDSVISPIIDQNNNTVLEGNQLRFDITSIHTTPAKGLILDMSFL